MVNIVSWIWCIFWDGEYYEKFGLVTTYVIRYGEYCDHFGVDVVWLIILYIYVN
jgi:hypothetical protein